MTTPEDAGNGAAPVALVTGAGRGIGAEVARQLAAAGHHVVVTARAVDAGRAVAAEIVAAGGSAEFQPCDVTDDGSVAALAAHLGDRPLHVLVNNAAAFADWSEQPSTAHLDVTATVLDTNVLGPWRVVQALLPALRRAGHARIVNVGSGAGSHGEPQFGLATGPAAPSYAVSKAALHALTVKFAQELRGTGILVHAVDPGLTATAPGMEELGARPIADGAASIVRTALAPDDGTTGGFFRDGEALPW